MKNKLSKNKAFTLIEVLISISIISLLATVIMYSTSEAKLKGEDAHMKIESDQVAKAIQLYKDDNGGKVPYPVSANYVQYKGQMINENDPDSNKRQAYRESMQILVDEGYLPEIPTSPDGSSYSYLVTEDEEDAVFVASLKVSGSSKNSCEVIDPGYTSCGGLIESFDFSDDCSTIDYDSETQECFNVETLQEGGVCNLNGSCEAYSVDSFTPDEACSWMEPDTYFGFICPYPEGPSANRMVVCDIEQRVCSGSSNSDYCSCT